MLWTVLSTAVSILLYCSIAYLAFLGVLLLPSLQSHAIYLHRVTLTWFQDVNFPTQWGFLYNQITPFKLHTADGETLHAWHILPLGLYQRHAAALSAEPPGLTPDIRDRLAFKLLRGDPESLLVLYLHGAAGTLGSGYRPPSYRAMSALAPDRIHTVAIDYRGFGSSTGWPSEEGLLTDALTLAKWAMVDAGIPPERIVVFSQSIGSAVAISLLHRLALSKPIPVTFRGIVLVASFSSAHELAATYSIAGTIPLLAPLTRIPFLYRAFRERLICEWPSKDKLADFVRYLEDGQIGSYNITIIHAKDDWDIPWTHSDTLFWSAVKVTLPNDRDQQQYLDRIEHGKRSSAGGCTIERKTKAGVLRQEIVEYGLHDRIMSYPIVSSAVWKAFQCQEESK